MLRGDTGLPALLERVREAFGQSSATLLRRADQRDDGSTGRSTRPRRPAWEVVAEAGTPTLLSDPRMRTPWSPPATACVLALRGRIAAGRGPADRRRLRGSGGRHCSSDRSAQRGSSRGCSPLAAADRMRTALLAAVGHDLRTPLASAKAATTSLRSKDVAWSPEDREELLATADESLDRLTALVDNLLDMSRLQAGVIAVERRPVALDEIVPRALTTSGRLRRRHDSTSRTTCRSCTADPGPARAGGGQPARPTRCATPRPTSAHGHRKRIWDRVELRVIDSGPGIAHADLERVFAPFQRLGDTDNTTGSRPGACACPRSHRGDGRDPDGGGDARWRADHGRRPCRRRAAPATTDRASRAPRTRAYVSPAHRAPKIPSESGL